MSSLAQTNEHFAEQQFYAERSLPRLYKNSYALSTAFLRSALFSANCKGDRPTHAALTQLRSHGDVQVWFKGQELRQDDERVLLALLKLRSGQVVSNVIEIPTPRAFCRDVLGWPDSSDSPLKLKASLTRLHDARVRVVKPGCEQLYSFVSDVNFDSKAGWSIWLSERLVTMFKDRVTYMTMEERLGVKDGLVSWLLGFVRADSCLTPMSLTMLRELSGSQSEQKQFNEDARKALKKLRDLGLLAGYTESRGAITIHKGRSWQDAPIEVVPAV